MLPAGGCDAGFEKAADGLRKTPLSVPAGPVDSEPGVHLAPKREIIWCVDDEVRVYIFVPNVGSGNIVVRQDSLRLSFVTLG